MVPFSALLLIAILARQGFAALPTCNAQRPNIVFIFTDDQDLHLNSLDYMQNVQKLIVDQGTTFAKHFATVSNCCPSRASLLRGQHGHNTNITHVRNPGGNYQKWRLMGEDNNYLPIWLQNAGYRTEYIGKFLNGYSKALYQHTPKGWDHIDALVDPWVYDFNRPVFSANGETPILFQGYHQTDVLRAKMTARLKYLTEEQEKPFYLTLGTVAPHVRTGGDLPIAQVRHQQDFLTAKAPRTKNFNPDQAYTDQKPSWLKEFKFLNQSQLNRIDEHYRRRVQTLQGVDEIVHDVVELLREKNILDNTYIVISADNGYHMGQHRAGAGKTLPYITDTNVPFLVRGPDVPRGIISTLPSKHLDLAPTFLEIACVDESEYPVFLDGRSVLSNWHNPRNETDPNHHDIINIEFWGSGESELPGQSGNRRNSYKAIRVIGTKSSWLYTKWCTGDTELYDTLVRILSLHPMLAVYLIMIQNDPWELNNLAYESNNPDEETKGLIHRLNGILLVTKSCQQDNCRNPWTVLQNHCKTEDPDCPDGDIFSNLEAAMDTKYDAFFRSLPKFNFKECLLVQVADNEEPFLPVSSKKLGGDFREHVDRYIDPSTDSTKEVPYNSQQQGTQEQRNVQIDKMMETARELTSEELGT
ncbi:unnamed protein product [Clonostachys rosea f. rosea IK726]|uniref:Sulfatase N-terminal domain-containing protein n=2 Tax=Bionectria ochroleuca TaxID=29856 RepID=A0A0B7KPP7_BIOOC|nr:unnamed protein product [Clonostachys rosea f. rosea IK726]